MSATYTIKTSGRTVATAATLSAAKTEARKLNTQPLSAGYVGTPIVIARDGRDVLTASVQAGRLYRVERV